MWRDPLHPPEEHHLTQVLSPSPEMAGLAAGEATLFRLAGLSDEPESMLEEVGRESTLIFIFKEMNTNDIDFPFFFFKLLNV